MARRTKEEMEQTRLALLDAALNLFAEKGYSKTSINDIAQYAGFTRGAFYWHFKDKVMIFTEAMRHYEAPGRELFMKELMSIDDPQEWMRALFVGYIRILSENADFQKAVFVRVRKTEFPEELQGFYAEAQQGQARMEHAILATLKKGIASGAFRSDLDPVVTAPAVMAYFMGLFGRLFSGAGPVPISESEPFVDVLLSGLKA